MSTINDGGPAFPVPDSHHANGQVQYGANGMTLRDWFAGQALQGLLACGEAHDEHTDSVTAGAAYKMADAMLKAREVKP
jgi:hypothetical protein